MSGRRQVSVSGGYGPFVLFVVFLVLKLTHVIEWWWLWVTAPLWIGAALVLALATVAALVVFCSSTKKKRTPAGTSHRSP